MIQAGSSVCKAPASPQFPRPPGVSISGARIQKLPLTRLEPVSRFGSVSDAIYQQGLDAPFIVELFTARAFAPRTGLVGSPTPRVTPVEAPDAGGVKRTSRALHPNGLCGCGPNPTDGIKVGVLAGPHPLGTARLAGVETPAKSVPVARVPTAAELWDRTWRLESKRDDLLPGASLELEEQLSLRIQLYGSFT